MNKILLLLLLGFLLASASYAIFSRSIINAIISLSVFSINMVVIFIMLQAPDVAMTEAVIGVGLITAIFVVTVSKTEGL